MGLYVTRDAANRIVSRFAVRQFPGQEYLADGAPDLTALALEDARAAKVMAAVATFTAKINAGLPYGGKVLQIRDQDRSNITGQSSRALASLVAGSGVAWPAGFAWRMQDNSYLALATAADMLALGAAASDRYSALRLKLGQVNDSIAGAADAAALAAIDVTAGWPA